MFASSKLLGAVCALLVVSFAAPTEEPSLAERQLLGGAAPKPDKVVAPKKLWNNKFVPYAMYASHMYRYVLGCSDPAPFGSRVVEFYNVKNTSTQALVYQNDASREFVIAIPGTSSPEDAVTDRKRFIMRPLKIDGVSKDDCKGCAVHHGFQRAWQSIQVDMATSLASNFASHGDYSLTIMGHSLGASIASIATAGLIGQGFPVKQSITFGQPRTGNHKYADYIDQITKAKPDGHGSFYRVTHANDNVPHHPSKLFGYKHHSTEFWEVDDSSGMQSAADTYECFGQEPKDCNLMTKAKHFITPAHLEYSNQNLNVKQFCLT